MANFDFITDEGLRRSLESDLNELKLCHEAKAWKAVHVLAGSIIEATLIDYLVSSGKVDAATANAKDLGQLIEMCKSHAVLSTKAIELSAIVRSYRNLIHPGRLLRLSDQVDENGATIAKSVIEIVVEEISNKKRQTYGYTAEQVVRKVLMDSSSLSIAEHLLRETNAAELKRLLLEILPAAYLKCCDSGFDEDTRLARRLSHVYRVGIKVADDGLRQLIGIKYVSVLKEESESIVRCYEVGLFRGADLHYIGPKDYPLVLAHFFDTLKQSVNEDVFEAAYGITAYLQGDSLKEFLKLLAAVVRRDEPTYIYSHRVGALLFHEAWQTETDTKRLRSAIAELKQEHDYSQGMQDALDAMDGVASVPF